MAEPSLDEKELELNRQRLGSEKARLVLEESFVKKYATPLFSVVVTIVAGFFALAQVWIASINRDKEIETTRLQNERQWKLNVADFVFKNREIIFSGNTEEQRRLRDVMVVTFPPEVTTGLFERIGVAVPIEQKQLWQDGQELALRVETTEAIQSEALTLFRQGQFDTAVSAYDKALTFEPNNVQLLNRKGYSLFRAKKFDDAIATLRQAVKLRPDHELANLNLVKALCAAGKTAEAEEVMRAAIKSKPALFQTALSDGEFSRTCKPILDALTH